MDLDDIGRVVSANVPGRALQKSHQVPMTKDHSLMVGSTVATLEMLLRQEHPRLPRSSHRQAYAAEPITP